MSERLQPGDRFRSTCQVAGDDWTVEEVYEAHCADGRIRLVVQADDGSLHFGDECVKQAAEPASECPKNWYTADSCGHLYFQLSNSGVPTQELAEHLQKALEKGWLMRGGKEDAKSWKWLRDEHQSCLEKISEQHSELADLRAKVESLTADNNRLRESNTSINNRMQVEASRANKSEQRIKQHINEWRILHKVVADLSKELDRQANEAWMRGDIQTADRCAKLAGWGKLPSEHEAADRQREGVK